MRGGKGGGVDSILISCVLTNLLLVFSSVVPTDTAVYRYDFSALRITNRADSGRRPLSRELGCGSLV